MRLKRKSENKRRLTSIIELIDIYGIIDVITRTIILDSTESFNLKGVFYNFVREMASEQEGLVDGIL